MVLITGGTGFLGAYIIKNLIEKGYAVKAIRRSGKNLFFIPQNILEKVEWVDGNVLDVVSLNEAMQNVDSIIHSAAMVSFSKKVRSDMYHVNVEGTANVINAAIDNKVKRFIHISSVAALGRTTKAELINEEKKWQENSNNTHYAISKHLAEMEAWRGFAEGLDGVIINPSTILGFGDWDTSSCKIFKNVYKEFAWYTTGINGFVGVEDVAEATVNFLKSGITNKRFVCNADNWTFQKVFNTIAENFNKKKPHKEATRSLAEVAWRLEKLKSLFTHTSPLLTRETARVANSKTSFDNSALLNALPGFSFTSLDNVIKNSCEKYILAIEKGQLAL
jgi:nucleoside-diphosphate-sugar epimerase